MESESILQLVGSVLGVFIPARLLILLKSLLSYLCELLGADVKSLDYGFILSPFNSGNFCFICFELC